jgi:hypothetical protein
MAITAVVGVSENESGNQMEIEKMKTTVTTIADPLTGILATIEPLPACG